MPDPVAAQPVTDLAGLGGRLWAQFVINRQGHQREAVALRPIGHQECQGQTVAPAGDRQRNLRARPRQAEPQHQSVEFVILKRPFDFAR